MNRHSHWALLVILTTALALMGCEGDQGPIGIQGPEGPAGPPGPPGGSSEFTYLGGSGSSCLHCHGGTVVQVGQTLHAQAYDDLAEKQSSADNPYCLQCHTTGWDSPIGYGETESTTYGDDLFGYDDYWNVETDLAASRRAMLEGVQCESCHGAMGPEFNGHMPLMSFNDHSDGETSASLCAKCHGGQLDEWATSGHANVADGDLEAFNEEHYTHNSSCDYCHTAEGFIKANDPAYADYDFPEQQSFIGCVTCHDPHAGANGSGNESQLRNIGAEEVQYDLGTDPGDAERPRMEGYGPAQTCVQCHHGRRDNANVAGQIADGSTHMGPHSSPQMDMFIGAGSYVIAGESYDSTHAHQGIQHACVDCHMVREALVHGTNQQHSFHSFLPEVGSCTGCHTSWTDFTAVEAFQASITAKLDELADRFGFDTWEELAADWDSTAAGVETWQREAAYAGFFVDSDGSRGVHNPDYAMDLLQNAIDYYMSNLP